MLELSTGFAVTNLVKLLLDDFYCLGICTRLVFESGLLDFLGSSMPEIPPVLLRYEGPAVREAFAVLTD